MPSSDTLAATADFLRFEQSGVPSEASAAAAAVASTAAAAGGERLAGPGIGSEASLLIGVAAMVPLAEVEAESACDTGCVVE